MHEDLERLLRQLEPLVALEKADGLLAADPDDSAARSCRIRSLWMLRRADESRAELQQALAERGADDAAIQVARGVLALGLRDDLIHVGTAYRFSTVGRDDSAAEDSFRSALALEPSNVEARRGLATALRLAGRRDEALAVLKTSPMEIGPAVATLLVEQAWCEFDLWHLEGAVERLDRVLAINDTDLEALYAKAFVLRVATDEAATRAVLERIEKLTPTWRVHLETELGAQQAEALQFIDDPVRHAAASKAAISHLNTALRLLPDHPAAWAGHMLAEAGHDADKDRPGGPGGLMSSADARLASASYGHRHNYTSWEKKAQQALALYRQALAADPLLVYARSREAECLRLLNRLTEARQAAETVLDLVPQHGIALTILALIEVDAGQPERALDAALAARLCGAHVLPRVWIELGLSDEAEAAAGAEIKRVEHVDADVRFCLFYSAFSVRLRRMGYWRACRELRRSSG